MTIVKATSLVVACGVLLSACASGPEQSEQTMVLRDLQASGVDSFKAGDYDTALLQFNRALHSHRMIDHTEGTVDSAFNIARTWFAMGEYRKATDWVKTARQTNALLSSPGVSGRREQLQLLHAEIAFASGDLPATSALLDQLAYSKNKKTALHRQKLLTRIAFATSTNSEDRQTAVAAYETAIKATPDASATHRARLSRLRAALSNDIDEQDALFTQALQIYREQGNRNAVASTLHDWARVALAAGDTVNAEHRLLRALYIRANTRNLNKTRSILASLHELYGDDNRNDAKKRETVAYWMDKTAGDGFTGWESLLQTFDLFPG